MSMFGTPMEAQPVAPVDTTIRLYVGNLSFDTDEQRLISTFSQFGPVADVFLPVYRDSGRKRGLAFITMGTREAGEAGEDGFWCQRP